MRRLLLASMLIVAVSVPAFARSTEDRVTVGGDITVAEGETAGDIACVFCSVHVHGDVRGDIAVAFGRISVDAGRSVSGDVAGFGTDLNMGQDATVGGDVAIAAGQARLASGASIHGDRSIAPGKGWLLLPLVPLAILAGLIWLIVYLVRRNRYQFPAYPNGRRF